MRYLKHCKQREKKNRDDEEDDHFHDDERRHLQIIKEFNKKYDALHYVLLFPKGQNSWGFYMPQVLPEQPEKKYRPPIPHRVHRDDSNEELVDFCDEYGLLLHCPRAARIKQVESYEIFRQKVRHFV